ncbi:hypothetical protein EON63_03120 [archaeon]|nr:MAG: hypothetical protein EON63_03120 [archaeon]
MLFNYVQHVHHTPYTIITMCTKYTKKLAVMKYMATRGKKHADGRACDGVCWVERVVGGLRHHARACQA